MKEWPLHGARRTVDKAPLTIGVGQSACMEKQEEATHQFFADMCVTWVCFVFRKYYGFFITFLLKFLRAFV